MGIRIHKRLGYALTDISYDAERWKFTDARLSSKINKEEWLWEINDAFVTWLKGQDRESLKELADEANLTQLSPSYMAFASQDIPEKVGKHRSVTHVPEFGNPSVLIFQPVSKTSWTRWDDSLDYYEANGEAGSPTLQRIKGSGIYPFNGSYHRKPHLDVPKGMTLEVDSLREKAFLEGRLDPYDYATLTGQWSEESYPQVHGEVLEHLLNDWSVIIPAQIQLFVHYSGIFTDFNTIYDLQPVIYTYWT